MLLEFWAISVIWVVDYPQNMSFGEWPEKEKSSSRDRLHISLSRSSGLEGMSSREGQWSSWRSHQWWAVAPLFPGPAGLAWIALSLCQHKWEMKLVLPNHTMNGDVLLDRVTRWFWCFVCVCVCVTYTRDSTYPDTETDVGDYHAFSIQEGFSHSLSLGWMVFNIFHLARPKEWADAGWTQRENKY